MGDEWDYKLRKMEMAWDLALRIIPDKPEDSGAWIRENYLARAQETLKQTNEAVNAVFKEA